MNPYDEIEALVQGSDYVSGEDPLVGAALAILQKAQSPALRMRQTAPATLDKLMARASAGKQPATFMGIGSALVAVAAGGTVTFQAQPTNAVRIVDFTVPETTAPNFVINDISIGRLRMFQGGNPIPADRFSKDAQRPPFEAPVVTSGTPITVQVTNTSGADAFFVAMFDCIDLIQGV